MPALPQRLSLVRQTANILRAEIERGTWSRHLPGERELAATLLVGRNTLRAALRELAAAGLLESRQGVGHRILRRSAPSGTKEKPRSIGLLLPGGLQAPRASQILWIDQLRALLIKQGFDLQLHHQRRFPRDPRRHACWILLLCDGDLQRRFARNGVPCVIAGSPHPGVNLPSVDIDHRSLCRHAAGIMIARGHQNLAFLTRLPLFAGDRESELGFIEGVRLSAQPGLSSRIIHHDDSRAGVTNALQRLLRSPRPPTALLIGDSHHYLTVSSLLARAGKNIPRDITLLCRDDDSFLSHLVPEPARYSSSPAAFARNVLTLILRDRRSPVPPAIRLQPRLVKGGTLARLVP
ncbi:MAG: substrate-binding domain-containing protein [Opitutaceae bacterium]